MGTDSASRTGSVLLVLLNDPTAPHAWDAFVDRYGPKIYGWCRKWGLQTADAENVTQEVLTKLVQKLRTFAYDPQQGTFRGWLQKLTHNALSDYLKSQRRAGVGSGDSEVLEGLQTLEAREDFLRDLAEVFDLEVLAEAQARVQLQVTPRDWKIFQDLTVEGRSGKAVAQQQQMTVTAVLMVKSRVQKKLRREIRGLEGVTPHPREGPA
jgi:RNA polymerase sigma-70 factor (ECF subfamily)